MPTITLTVPSGAHDAEQRADGSNFNASGTTIRVTPGLVESQKYNLGLVFTDVDIPQGSTIDAAILKPYTTSFDDPALDIYGEATDNALDFSTHASVNNRTRTSASVPWVASNVGVFQRVNSPDIKSVVQEIVDRPGWAPGNSLCILLWSRPGTARNFEIYAFESGQGFAAQLQITFTPSVVVEGEGSVEVEASAEGAGQKVIQSETGAEVEVDVSATGQKQGLGSAVAEVVASATGTGEATKQGTGAVGVVAHVSAMGARPTILTPGDRQAALLDDPLAAPDGTIAGRERGWLLGQYYGSEDGVQSVTMETVYVDVEALLAAIAPSGTASRTLEPVEVDVEALAGSLGPSVSTLTMETVVVDVAALMQAVAASGAVTRELEPVEVDVDVLDGRLILLVPSGMVPPAGTSRPLLRPKPGVSRGPRSPRMGLSVSEQVPPPGISFRSSGG